MRFGKSTLLPARLLPRQESTDPKALSDPKAYFNRTDIYVIYYMMYLFSVKKRVRRAT